MVDVKGVGKDTILTVNNSLGLAAKVYYFLHRFKELNGYERYNTFLDALLWYDILIAYMYGLGLKGVKTLAV